MKSNGTTGSIGAFDAKTRLSELLDRVEEGESIVITRHGVPIARLVPVEVEIDARKTRKAIEGLRLLRKQFLKGGPGWTAEEIRRAIGDGRR